MYRYARTLLSRPEALLAGTFALLILAGSLVLWLPVCHAERPVSYVDALFTSTSAVCVTGLVTVDTAHAYSRVGHVAIMVLIQLGGLGIMTFAALAAQLFRLRFSFSSHAAWQGALFDAEARGDLRRSLVGIFVSTALIEAGGAVLFYCGLRLETQVSGGWFEAAFHAVSAFCNAGFSVYSDNIVALRDSHLIVWTIMALIVAGGLGYMVIFELLGRGVRWVRRLRSGPVCWSLHGRVVLQMTALLVLGGAAVLMLTGLTATERTLWERFEHAMFQSVSARTAGFNSLDVGRLPLSSLLILTGLMFIGGSPGSCAGGIKTSTTAVWLARVKAHILGREDVVIAGRRLPTDVVRRATFVLATAGLWNLIGVMILALLEGDRAGMRFEQLVFEQISAFGTVGLSANPGSTISVSGLFAAPAKLWIAATMFFGRVGPLTMALAVVPVPRSLYKYPTEKVMIG
jgi:trk system potassium uptake protein TrkH